MNLCTLDDVKQHGSIGDTADDAWLAAAVASVSAVFEAEARRWLAPRPAVVRLLDGAAVDAGGRALRVPDGVSALASLAAADSDQPDDGSGAYTPITRGIHLRGALGPGWPATRIELDASAERLLPTAGYGVVRVEADWGPAAVAPRVREMCVVAVVRGWRARQSGLDDVAVARADGGTAVLRRIAPAEMEELVRDWAPDTRPALASVAAG